MTNKKLEVSVYEPQEEKSRSWQGRRSGKTPARDRTISIKRMYNTYALDGARASRVQRGGYTPSDDDWATRNCASGNLPSPTRPMCSSALSLFSPSARELLCASQLIVFRFFATCSLARRAAMRRAVFRFLYYIFSSGGQVIFYYQDCDLWRI